jgi:hypothetical protein
MKDRIQKIINEIKRNAVNAEESNYGIVIDEILEQISLIEYELFSDELNDVFSVDEDDY